MGIIALIPGKLGYILACIAVLGSAFDYLENSAVSAFMVEDLSKLSPNQVMVASQWTVLKSIFGAIAITALLVAVMFRLVTKARAKKAATPSSD